MERSSQSPERRNNQHPNQSRERSRESLERTRHANGLRDEPPSSSRPESQDERDIRRWSPDDLISRLYDMPLGEARHLSQEWLDYHHPLGGPQRTRWTEEIDSLLQDLSVDRDPVSDPLPPLLSPPDSAPYTERGYEAVHRMVDNLRRDYREHPSGDSIPLRYMDRYTNIDEHGNTHHIRRELATINSRVIRLENEHISHDDSEYPNIQDDIQASIELIVSHARDSNSRAVKDETARLIREIAPRGT